MKRELFVLAAGLSFVAFLGTGVARGGDDPSYQFRAGETVIYEISIKMQIPERMRTETSFIALHPISVDADGQTRLAYSWGIENGAASLSWLWGASPGANGKQLSIDPHGTILDASSVEGDAQLGASQGNAWRLVLQPLPTAGQNTWTAQRPIKLVDPRRGLGPFGGMPFGGPFGGGPFGGGPFGGGPFGGGGQVPSDVEATEKITYALQPPAGNRMTVNRQYDLATPQDAGDHYEHIHGDGQYIFDVRSGRVTSLEWKLSADVKNGTVPVTVDARLITPNELAMLKDAADAEIAAQKKAKDAEVAKIKAEGRLSDDEGIADYTNLPDGMIRTQILEPPMAAAPSLLPVPIANQ